MDDAACRLPEQGDIPYDRIAPRLEFKEVIAGRDVFGGQFYFMISRGPDGSDKVRCEAALYGKNAQTDKRNIGKRIADDAALYRQAVRGKSAGSGRFRRR